MTKEKNVSDLDKELNFDDIAGKKTQSKKPDKPKKVVSGKTNESTGTVLSIPTDKPGEWVSKDLADCTGKDFIAWAQDLYPVNLEKEEERLDKLSNRIRAFKNILYYHTTSLFQTGKTGEKNTTKH